MLMNATYISWMDQHNSNKLLDQQVEISLGAQVRHANYTEITNDSLAVGNSLTGFKKESSILINIIPILTASCTLAFAIAHSSKNQNVYLIEELKYSADLMGCWLDFVSFIPILLLLIIKNFLYPSPNDIYFNNHVVCILLLTAFASGCTWI